MGEVVGIHARDERRACGRDAGIERAHQPAWRAQKAETRIAGYERSSARERAVERAVVDEQALERRQRLCGDAVQRVVERGGRVAERQDDADARDEAHALSTLVRSRAD